MKIVFGIGQIKYSGAENVARFLMDKLISEGHEVITLIYTAMPQDKETIEKYHTVDCIIKDSGICGIVKRILKTRKIIELIKADVVLAFNCEYAFPMVPALMGVKDTKLIVCERNDPISVPKSKQRRMMRDLLYRFADAGVFQTEVISEHFGKIVKKRFVIPNPIREKGKMCSPLEERKKVFATVARLDDFQKNQSMMIKAFAEIVKQYPEYELHLLGDGPDKDKYEKLIVSLGVEKNIRLLGEVEAPTEYLKKCHGFLLTSEFEGMPNALVEAMSIGLPCISTDCGGGGAAYLIKNGDNGLLIQRGDELQLIQAIKLLIEDKNLCNRLGNHAFKINKSLDGEIILGEWLAIFHEIVSEQNESTID